MECPRRDLIRTHPHLGGWVASRTLWLGEPLEGRGLEPVLAWYEPWSLSGTVRARGPVASGPAAGSAAIGNGGSGWAQGLVTGSRPTRPTGWPVRRLSKTGVSFTLEPPCRTER